MGPSGEKGGSMGSFPTYDPGDPPYRVKAVLTQARRLQQLESQMVNQGVAELMRMAVNADPSDEMAVILCRLLFRSPQGGPLRWAMRGQPGFLGWWGADPDTAAWPHAPVHLFRGVPFYVVSGWLIAGFPEPASWYLAHCLRHGVWNADPFPDPADPNLRAVAEAFIEGGPWRDPLGEHERQFLLTQVE